MTEPTNKQLAEFMCVYAQSNPLAAHLGVQPYTLELIFEHDESKRQLCLKIHRDFQAKVDKHTEKLQKGEMQCEYVRQNGKRCPNFNQPGSYFCGLHQESEDEDGFSDAGISDDR